MKLNIKAHSENGKVRSCSGNEYIIIELNHKNDRVYTLKFHDEGMLTLYDKEGYSRSVG